MCGDAARSGGKSTIVHLFLRFYDIHQGQILLDDQPLSELNIRSLHKVSSIRVDSIHCI